MIKDILVCLEGSPSSEAATRTAIEIARERKAGLVGMAIIDKPDICAGMPASIGGSSFRHERDESLLADAHAHAADWLGLFERRCRSEGVVAHTLEIVGRPAESIISEIERHDVTVIGRDANFRFETLDDDSATRDKILRHASHPVLLVPDASPEAPANLSQTVLIAYDGSESSKRALASFTQSGLAESRDLHVATVGDDGEKAWDIANRAVESLRAFGIKAFTHNIVSLLPTSEALVELGRDLGAGLFVMGAFGRSRLAELLHGSGTRSIVENSTAPLCLQH
jgi:nucleotide-binding universal stress UspA family protein